MTTRQPAMSRGTSLAVVWGAYLWAAAISLTVGSMLPIASPLVRAGIVNLVATMLIFAVSVIFDNSSVYDPYWSVAPIALTGYWVLSASGDDVANPRGVIVFALVALWGTRLTLNFFAHWKGMQHEDWRYEAYREKAGRFYWVVSVFGFHLIPTVIVFAGCVPIYYACTNPSALGTMDGVAAVVTLAAIIVETVADAQMRAAAATGEFVNSTFRGGLWAYSRHPNYFGEVVFWWGMFLFALGADAAYWWTVFGPLGVTVLFLVVSLPLIEDRMIERRDDYSEVQAEVSKLIPWFRRRI